MVYRFDQGRHFVVRIVHVFFSLINVIPKFLNANILRFYFRSEILRLVLCRFDHANNLIKLFILILNHIFLELQHFLVFQVPCMVEFSVLSFLVDLLFFLSNENLLDQIRPTALQGQNCLIDFSRALPNILIDLS